MPVNLGYKSSSLYATRASAYGWLDDERAAERDLTTAIQLNDTYALAYHSRGLTRWRLKDYRGAEADFRQALRLAVPGDEAFLREVRMHLNDLLKSLNR